VEDLHLKKALLPFFLLIFACSPGSPPDEMFRENIEKMVLIDRAMGFHEEIARISIVSKTKYEDQVEVEVQVEGWATHSDLAIGATLPASRVKNEGWSTWKFFCKKVDKTWVIVEKYKVEEGFEKQ
jgi:hypothetical protein